MAEQCTRCDTVLNKDNERKVVVDFTWYPSKYETLHYKLCEGCCERLKARLKADVEGVKDE